MINYGRLWEAKSFYESRGYRYMEVPWVAHKEYIDITKPPNKKSYAYQNGYELVGSAEQSFIEAMTTWKSFSLEGKYQSITPCFRDEPYYDWWHQPYFMKLELFCNEFNDDPEYEFASMLCDAIALFHNFGVSVEVKRIGENASDIVDSKLGVELGSYGIGNHKDIGTWCYATGLAEPRLSALLERYENLNYV